MFVDVHAYDPSTTGGLHGIRREFTLKPLKPVLERTSGMRIFEGEEVVEALEERGFTGIHRRISGMVQFVGGRLPAPT